MSIHGPAIEKAINRFWRQQCRPPTMREIMDMTDAPSPSVVSYHMYALHKAGRITLVGSKGDTRRAVPAWVAKAVHEGRPDGGAE